MRSVKYIIVVLSLSVLTFYLTNNYIPATAVATILTTVILFIEKQRGTTDREIKEKIYSVVVRQLQAFLVPAVHTISSDGNGRGLSIRWDWNTLKNQQFHIVEGIPKDIFGSLEKFTVLHNKYIDSFSQCVKEIFREISSRVKNYRASGSKEVFYVDIKVRGKGGHFRFDMFECLFIEKDIKKTLKEFRLKNEAEAEIKCNFLNGAQESSYITSDENEIIKFFEELFQNIKEKSENYKNLVSSRESAKDLAKQILKQISSK